MFAPTLFNIFTHDLPNTISKKFVNYADDICIATQGKNSETIEQTLEKDFNVLENYFKMWRLIPNPSKTVVSLFHLNSRAANQVLTTCNFCGHRIKHDKFPVYLGVTLDRTLTYKYQVLEIIASKLKFKTASISKLAGKFWSDNTQVLRTSTMASLFSVAEYCSLVLEGSTHCRLVDTGLRKCLLIITGTAKSTKIQLLPVLANIDPPYIHQQNTVMQIRTK